MKTCLHKIFPMQPKKSYKHKQEKRKKSELTPTKLKLKRKINVLLQKIRRQTKKISSLKDITDNLKRNHLLKEAPYESLKEVFWSYSEMLKNEMQIAKRKCKGHRYTDILKKICINSSLLLSKSLLLYSQNVFTSSLIINKTLF